MNRTVMTAAILALSATATQADVALSMNIDLEDAALTTVTYECGDAKPFDVLYATSGDDVLAVVPVDGDARIFVNVVAASGSRYVAGQYEWWVKGENATLGDLIADTSRQCAISSQ